MANSKRFAVLVVTKDGRATYVCDGTEDEISAFLTKPQAERNAKVWRDNLGDEVQSVNVVPHPSR